MNASEMLTIILPGYSLHNKDWAEAVKKNIKIGHEVRVHPWRHWSGGSMSFKYEIEKIIQETDGAELNIIAKSVGTEVCAQFLLRKTNEAPAAYAAGIFSTRFVGAKSAEAENSSRSSTSLRSRFSAKVDKIHKIILCGVPSVSLANAEVFSRAFADFTAKNIVVFQNVKDPFATFAEVKKFMQQVNPQIKVIAKPRSDHNYLYYEDFQNFLEK